MKGCARAPPGEVPSDEQVVGHAGRQQNHPDDRELEHLERADPVLLGDGADQDVRRSADQRAGSAQRRVLFCAATERGERTGSNQGSHADRCCRVRRSQQVRREGAR